MALPARALSLVASFLAPVSTPAPPLRLAQHGDAEVLAMVFSKDRPGQLLASLVSLGRLVRGVVRVHVIWKATTPQARQAYAVVLPMLGTWVVAREESHSFLADVIAGLTTSSSSKSRAVLFLVDDAVYYGAWDATQASRFLQANSNVLCVHSKLWPGATRCHAAHDKPMVVPKQHHLPRLGQGQDDNRRFYVFDRRDGTLDWNYPWDLSGALYRVEDVVDGILPSILASHHANAASWNPNLLEARGNAQFPVSLALQRPLSACPPQRVMSIVTVNRVQTEFPDNPVYPHASAAEPPWAKLTDLLVDYNHGFVDSRKYASASYDAVHVGDLFVYRSIREQVALSVLLPVRNNEATLQRAVASLLAQDLGRDRMEIVIVDDASQDASWAIAAQLCAAHPDLVRLVRRKRCHGLAACLDFGLEFCRAPIIARMDADDECLPGRLRAQLDEFARRPRLGVLGAGAWVISASNPRKLAPTPCGPASVAWSLFFFCPLVHPTICIRRGVFDDMNPEGEGGGGGYMHAVRTASSLFARGTEGGQHIVRAEDYCLYLYMVQHLAFYELDNLPVQGLNHYKHVGSTTAQWDEQDWETAVRVGFRVAQRFAPSLTHVTDDVWFDLLRKKSADHHRTERTNEEKRRALELLRSGLGELSQFVLNRHISSSVSDSEFVARDCDARMIEAEVLFKYF